MKTIYSLLFSFSVLFFIGCIKSYDNTPDKTTGYKPVYLDTATLHNVYSAAPKEIKNPGKIYYKDNYIFINEVNEGIHVIDNANPASPQNISFINIAGNMDLAIKNKTLYADNAVDLLAINISNPQSIIIVKRIKNAFPVRSYPDERGYFECVDSTKGVVIAWQKATIIKPKCYR